jgi:hypothetical protein
MKLPLYLLVLVVLTACSSEEQTFVCVNEKYSTLEGLIIKNKEATLGYLSNMKLCESSGTKDIYSTDCSARNKFLTFIFDKVTYEANTFSPSSSDSKYTSNFTFYKCEKK